MSRIVAFFCSCLVFSTLSMASTSTPARVSHVEGTAAVAQEGDVDWLEIPVNMPVRSLDRIVLQEESVLEIELGAANLARLGPLTDVVFSQLDDSRLDLSMTAGDLILRIGQAPYPVVSFSAGQLKIREPGIYRIGYRSGGRVRVTVRKGSAEAVTQAGFRVLTVGQVVEIVGTDDGLREVSRIDLKDDFDFWSDRRDAGRVKSRTFSYVGSGYAGAYDLDRHGEWGYEEEHGWVWWPTVGLGWSPYEYGDWTFYPSWGWTWVSDEPWGWLPYHYGRWVSTGFGSRWGWVPYGMGGWSPALVFFGFSDDRLHWWPCMVGEDPNVGQRSPGYRRERRPGMMSVPVSDFTHRLRVRAERRSLVTEVPLPGTARTLSLLEHTRMSPRPPNESGRAVELDRHESTRSSALTRPGPRVLTIPVNTPVGSSVSYPDRSRMDRLPSLAARPSSWSRGITIGTPSTVSPTRRSQGWNRRPGSTEARGSGDPAGSSRRQSGVHGSREGTGSSPGPGSGVSAPRRGERTSPRIGTSPRHGGSGPATRSAPRSGSSGGAGSRAGGARDR